jgi:voltage-gated potassium channel
MFALSLFFLAMIALLITAQMSLEPIGATGETAGAAAIDRVLQAVQSAALILLLAIWPVFIAEQLLDKSSRSRARRLVVCLVPPLRMAVISPEHNGSIWLPRLGWQQPGRALSRQLERALSKPMLVVALLILPVLLVEFGMGQLVAETPALRLLLHVATGLIWLAFTAEFIVMMGATDRKLRYVKSHWIDLAIIILPLISFLRGIRVLRIARIARLQQVAKMTRVYRMRGLLMKTMRALMLLEVVHRLLGGNSQRKLAQLKLQYQEQLEDLQELKAEIDSLETELQAQPGDDAQLATG